MIFLDPPEDFQPKFYVVSCFLEHDGKFLTLKRHPSKTEGGKWGTPGGKRDDGESELEALVREVQEETGIALSTDRIGNSYPVYVRYPDYDYVFHMFAGALDEKPEITLSLSEHTDYAWVTPEQALKMDLVMDQDVCIRRFHYLDEDVSEDGAF